MKTGPAVLVSLVVGAAALAGFLVGVQRAGDGKHPPSPPPSPMCDATVKVSLQPASAPGGKKTIVVDPEHSVCLARTRTLNWDIRGAGDVSIVFKKRNIQGVDVYGPFREAGGVYNPKRGEYKRPSGDPLDKLKTEGAEDKPEFVGEWKYTVIWKTGALDDPDDLDPAVCIRD